MKHPTNRLGSTRARDELFRCLADGSRRFLLRCVHDQAPSGITESDLATHFAAFDHGKPRADVTDREYSHALTALRHRQLPIAEETNVLEVDADDQVTTTDHPAFEDPELVDVITGEENALDTSLDDLFNGLSNSRRRTTLAVLVDQRRQLSVRTLAREVTERECAREPDANEQEPSQERIDRTHVSLVHVHLPYLRDADLVKYDSKASRVSHEGHPALRTRWVEPALEEPSELHSSAQNDDSESIDVETVSRS